jgi:hypothetical protein
VAVLDEKEAMQEWTLLPKGEQSRRMLFLDGGRPGVDIWHTRDYATQPLMHRG